jgi:UvrB/uvrC motif
MPDPIDIDNVLRDWPFDPLAPNVRSFEIAGRRILQMRVDMGILQLEADNRPDGSRPHEFATYLDYLENQAKEEPELTLSDHQCMEIDREFVQFYHRRICWLQLKEFLLAVRDADHTLALMDFCRDHSPSEPWTLSHEQYRPFVLYHRTQAAALDLLQRDNGAELAIEEVNRGLETLRNVFAEFEAEEQYEEDELVQRLIEFRESLRDRFEVGKTLQEQLADAVAAEQYELAARLRDRMNKRETD